MPGRRTWLPEARPQREQRLELTDLQQTAAEEVDDDRSTQRAAERDELCRERPPEARVERVPDRPRDGADDGRRAGDLEGRRRDRAAVDAMDAAAQHDEERPRAGDIADRRRE